MENFETGKNNQQPASKAEPVRPRPDDGLTREELCAAGREMYKAKDFSNALIWFEKAAAQGHADAQYFCGMMYSEGKGTAADQAKALMWLEKAAEQDHVSAQQKYWAVKKYNITQSRYDELQNELHYCKTVRTSIVKKMLDEARSLGDLSENEAYDEAREAQASLRIHMEEIEDILQKAVITDKSAAGEDVL